MALTSDEQAEIKAGFWLFAVDEKLTEDVVQKAVKDLKIGISENEIHDMFILFGGGKGGFTEDAWLKAMQHTEYKDDNPDMKAAFESLASNGRLDWDKVKKALTLNGRSIIDEIFETLQNVCDYQNDGCVDFEDFITMIHAEPPPAGGPPALFRFKSTE